jgi:hypothetical protein
LVAGAYAGLAERFHSDVDLAFARITIFSFHCDLCWLRLLDRRQRRRKQECSAGFPAGKPLALLALSVKSPRR